jgi:DNA-binding CsgD family transcriptional regulator
MCYLIKLHIPVKNMADIMGISPNSVSKKKQRLKEIIYSTLSDQRNKTQSLDIWVWEF